MHHKHIIQHVANSSLHSSAPCIVLQLQVVPQGPNGGPCKLLCMITVGQAEEVLHGGATEFLYTVVSWVWCGVCVCVCVCV